MVFMNKEERDTAIWAEGHFYVFFSKWPGKGIRVYSETMLAAELL